MGWEACSLGAEDNFTFFLRAPRVHLVVMHKLDAQRNKSPDAFFSYASREYLNQAGANKNRVFAQDDGHGGGVRSRTHRPAPDRDLGLRYRGV